ncbi:glycosyltransferase family 2 protein [Oenococcus sicerae]|uniref:glycosyltransferase family 2 protein n=1 Tax=Oenococcus sicerae TaxID=2203724 RepID=UPI002657C9E1|nr:glycosyltransferase family 2 protein [Oenococcus sicerae]
MREIVSVIIPIYNVEAYIRESVMSVLNQSYKPIEIILIDDGSTDQSGKIADDLSNEYQNVQVRHTSNRGLSSARNLGIGISHGSFLYFFDSDDLIEKSLLQDAISFMNEAKLDFVSFTNDFIDEQGNKLNRKQDNAEYNVSKVLENKKMINLVLSEKVRMSAWSYVVKKSVLIKNDIYFSNGKRYEDNNTTPVIIQDSSRTGILAKKNYFYHHYRMRSKSITHEISSSNIDDWLYMINYNRERFSDLDDIKYYLFSRYLSVFFLSTKVDYYLFDEINKEIRNNFSFKFIFKNPKVFLKFSYWIFKSSLHF